MKIEHSTFMWQTHRYSQLHSAESKFVSILLRLFFPGVNTAEGKLKHKFLVCLDLHCYQKNLNLYRKIRLEIKRQKQPFE